MQLVLLAGCSAEPPAIPPCFEPDSAPEGELELLALEDAKLRSASDCSGPEQQCSYAVRTRDSGIDVSVNFATLNRASGGCLYLPGGHETHYYDVSGAHIETMPGM